MKDKYNRQIMYADVIVDFLVEKKLTHVFDLTGGMIAFIEDAVSRNGKINCVPMHHEQAAGFAAEGYSRKSGNFGVALATSGPGATNLITAIGSCYFDSVPTMFITGQVHTSNIKKNKLVRQEGFQETDIVNAVKGLTKYSVLVKNPNLIRYELEKAYRIMKNGRPGPVLIDIPIDLQRTLVDNSTLVNFDDRVESKNSKKDSITKVEEVDQTKVVELEVLLRNSKSPLVLVGHGVRLSGTEKQFFDFVKNNNLPVVTSLLGIDAYPYSKNLVGYIGSNGNRDANIVFANADLILALGTRLDLRQTGDPKFFSKDATLVHVDIDKNSIDYSLKSSLSFNVDLKIFFEATSKIYTDKKKPWDLFVTQIKSHFSRSEVILSKVNPNIFFEELSSMAKSNTTVIADVGQNQQWCAQSWKTKKGQRLFFSGGMGAMGFSLPAAVGTWFADKKTNIIVVTGDGGLQINIQELETVGRNKIPMKIFVMNNNSLGMVREFQDQYLNNNYQSTVIGYGNPDFKKLAAAYGIDYELISKTNDRATIKKVMDSKNPTLVEVEVDIKSPLQPKIVYGHSLEDQSPYLNDEQKQFLIDVKEKLKNS